MPDRLRAAFLPPRLGADLAYNSASFKNVVNFLFQIGRYSSWWGGKTKRPEGLGLS